MCHIKNNSSSHRANLAQTSLKETGHDESVEMQKWETHGVQFITSQENGYRLIWRPILADSLCNYHATRSTESKPVRVEGLRMNVWDCTRSVCIKMEAKPCGSKKSPWTCHDESGPDEPLHMLARLLIDPHGAFLVVLIEHVWARKELMMPTFFNRT